MATDVGRSFDGAVAGKYQGRLLGWTGGPAVGPRVPGRSDFDTRWDCGLLPLGLVALPWQLRHRL